MAFIYQPSKDSDGKEFWKDTLNNEYIEQPSAVQQAADVLLSHSKIDYCLASIIAYINSPKMSAPSAISKLATKNMNELNFSIKVRMLIFNEALQPTGKLKNLFQDLKSMQSERNKLAHSNLISRLFLQEHIVKISKEVAIHFSPSCRVDLNIETINQVFKEYTRLCGKYREFFMLTTEEQVQQLRAQTTTNQKKPNDQQ